MSSAARLRHGRDIAAVLRGRRRAGRLLGVHVRDRGDGDPARVAVLASRRVGNAVARNRAKRLLREAARTVWFRSGIDVVLVARTSCVSAAMPTVRAELAELLDQLSVQEPV